MSDTTANFYNGLGIDAGAPQTQKHIGTCELQFAANGDFGRMGIGSVSVASPPDSVLHCHTGALRPRLGTRR